MVEQVTIRQGECLKWINITASSEPCNIQMDDPVVIQEA